MAVDLRHPRRADHPIRLAQRRHRRTAPLHLLVQPEPHADEPVMGGMGIDKVVEGLVAFAVALGCQERMGRPRSKRVTTGSSLKLTQCGRSLCQCPMSAKGRSRRTRPSARAKSLRVPDGNKGRQAVMWRRCKRHTRVIVGSASLPALFRHSLYSSALRCGFTEPDVRTGVQHSLVG